LYSSKTTPRSEPIGVAHCRRSMGRNQTRSEQAGGRRGRWRQKRRTAKSMTCQDGSRGSSAGRKGMTWHPHGARCNRCASHLRQHERPANAADRRWRGWTNRSPGGNTAGEVRARALPTRCRAPPPRASRRACCTWGLPWARERPRAGDQLLTTS
jgi:hypothetical protein